MSYDLSLFVPTAGFEVRDGARLHAALCEGKPAAQLARTAQSKRALSGLYRALTKRWPELDDAEDPDDTPWTVRIDRGDHHILLTMSFSWVEDVLPVILELARKAGVDVFDPQTQKRHRPSDPKPAAPAKKTPTKLKPSQIVAGLREGLGPAMTKLGFAPAKDRLSSFVAWERKTKGGVAAVMVQTGYSPRDARLWIRVHLDELARGLAPSWPFAAPPDVVRCELLGFYRDDDGGVKENPWALERLEYEVCHDDCLAKALPKLAKDVKEHALPALDALATPKQLDAIFNAPGSIKLGYLQEYVESRFVAAALAGITKRKDRAEIFAQGRRFMRDAMKRKVDHGATKPVDTAFDALVKQFG